MRPNIEQDFNNLNKNHSQYNGDQLNDQHRTYKKQVKSYYNTLAFNTPFSAIADNPDLNHGYNSRANDRKSRIEELKSYLDQKIVIKSESNPYYDNSLQPHSSKESGQNRKTGKNGNPNQEGYDTSSSDQVFKRVKREESARSQLKKQYTFNIPLSTDGTSEEGINNLEPTPLPVRNDYSYGLRNFGNEGEEMKRKFKQQEEDLADELYKAIQNKKMRKEKLKAEAKAKEEILDQKNQQYVQEQNFQERIYQEDEEFRRRGIPIPKRDPRFNKKGLSSQNTGSNKEENYDVGSSEKKSITSEQREEAKAFYNSYDEKFKEDSKLESRNPYLGNYRQDQQSPSQQY